MSTVQWDNVFSDSNAAFLLRNFVEGSTGLRTAIRGLSSSSARTELYRLEKRGVAAARRSVRSVLSRRGY